MPFSTRKQGKWNYSYDLEEQNNTVFHSILCGLHLFLNNILKICFVDILYLESVHHYFKGDTSRSQ